jgi:hypothetical protein
VSLDGDKLRGHAKRYFGLGNAQLLTKLLAVSAGTEVSGVNATQQGGKAGFPKCARLCVAFKNFPSGRDRFVGCGIVEPAVE